MERKPRRRDATAHLNLAYLPGRALGPEAARHYPRAHGPCCRCGEGQCEYACFKRAVALVPRDLFVCVKFAEMLAPSGNRGAAALRLREAAWLSRLEGDAEMPRCAAQARGGGGGA